MEPIGNSVQIQGDFTEEKTQEEAAKGTLLSNFLRTIDRSVYLLRLAQNQDAETHRRVSSIPQPVFETHKHDRIPRAVPPRARLGQPGLARGWSPRPGQQGDGNGTGARSMGQARTPPHTPRAR